MALSIGRIAAFALLLLSVAAPAACDLSYWREVLVKTPMSALGKTMSDPLAPAWPMAPSRTFIENLPADDKALGNGNVHLVQDLLKKAERSFEPGKPASVEEIENFGTIANRLQSAKGYTNEVAADVFRKMAAFRIAQALREKTLAVEEVKTLVQNFDVPPVKPVELLERFAPEDPEIAKRHAELKAAKADVNAAGVLQSLGLLGVMMQPSTSDHLIKKPSAAAFLLRVASTELLFRFCIPAAITFLEKGGTLDELDPADIRRFERRMGNDVNAFQYAPLGKRRLSVSDVLHVFELTSEGQQRDFFLKALW